MTLPIEYAVEVREDIDSAYAWYEEQQSGLGERFLLAISDVVTRIQSSPEGFGRVRGDVRAGLARDFPYVSISGPKKLASSSLRFYMGGETLRFGFNEFESRATESIGHRNERSLHNG